MSNRVGINQHISGNLQNPIMQIFSFRSFAFGFALFDHLVVLGECNQCSFMTSLHATKSLQCVTLLCFVSV